MPPFHRQSVRPAGRLAATLLAATAALAACGEMPVAPAHEDLPLAGPRSVLAASTPTTWYMRRADGSFDAVQFGTSDDLPVHADYDGDGKTDQAVFRPTTGRWFILRSSDLITLDLPYGAAGDRPVPADYDGDGKTDLAVFRPGTGQWYLLTSGNGQTAVIPFGNSTDTPVPADYDGDGKADLAVFRAGMTAASWWIRRSSDAGVVTGGFGLATDVPVPADFDGDGRADLAVWRASSSQFWIQRSSTGVSYPVEWGNSTDTPVVGDYDGDSKADVAVFRSSTAQWWIVKSSNDMVNIITFGLAGDRPVPGDYANAGSVQLAVRRDGPPPPAPQYITVNTIPPQRGGLDATYAPNATGGASGNPVVVATLTPETCTVDGDVVTFTAIGLCTVTLNQAGNDAYLAAPQVTLNITVIYPFSFAGPAVRAGNIVRVSFNLQGDRGLNILASGYPITQQVDCTTPTTTIGSATPAEYAGQRLAYSPETGLYTFSWKTDRKAWEGTCRKLVIRLLDGVDHTSIYQF